jgi:hypothetical protein
VRGKRPHFPTYNSAEVDFSYSFGSFFSLIAISAFLS